uniref:Uncharacterized protein n=1 Tax=Magallana gigas TaxID=29159 RepID=A0A8W8LY58_MAGGI
MKATLLCLAVLCGCLLVQARPRPKNGEGKDALDRLERLLENLEERGIADNEKGERRRPPPRDGDNEDVTKKALFPMSNSGI